MNENDTIAAISTALSPGGIGIIRVSGKRAIETVNGIFEGADLISASSHTVHYGKIIDEGNMIDEVLVTVMRAPRTYTREDVSEISCHGGILVLRKVLALLYSKGVRPAEPGEFTKRAFLNGRIDLSEAEAVMDIISSENELSLSAAEAQLSGSLSKEIHSLRAVILEEIAYIEAALDDPEHYELSDYGIVLEEHLRPVVSAIEHLLSTADDGILLRNGIKTAIVGRPNAGKSSLLNALAKKERAIVTDIPGTTRDTLEEKINFQGITLNVIDTAGIRDTSDEVERLGVSRSLDTIKEADFVIAMIDGSRPLSEEDQTVLFHVSDKKAVVLLNKADLSQEVSASAVAVYTSHPVISVSVKEGFGLDELKEHIVSLFFHGDIFSNDEILLKNERHKVLLRDALESLRLVRESISSGMPEDFYSIDLMNAYASLGKIIGEEVEDDLVNEIFSKFCMGK